MDKLEKLKWVKTNESLPEDNKLYLCYHKEYDKYYILRFCKEYLNWLDQWGDEVEIQNYGHIDKYLEIKLFSNDDSCNKEKLVISKPNIHPVPQNKKDKKCTDECIIKNKNC